MSNSNKLSICFATLLLSGYVLGHVRYTGETASTLTSEEIRRMVVEISTPIDDVVSTTYETTTLTSDIHTLITSTSELIESYVMTAASTTTSNETTTTSTTTTEETTTTTTEETTTTTTTTTTTEESTTTTTTTTNTTTKKKTTTIETTTTELTTEETATIDPDDYYNIPITESERIMLTNLVAHEYGANWISTAEKAKIVMVVMNRVNSKNFPNDIHKVILQKGQFCNMPDNRYIKQVTQDCIEAVYYYFNHVNDYSTNLFFYYGDGFKNTFREHY